MHKALAVAGLEIRGPMVHGPEVHGEAAPGATPACIVETDREASAEIARALRLMGCKTYETTSGALALFIASQIKLRVMVVDVLAPGGLALIKLVRERTPGVRIIALSNGGRAGIPLFLELAHYAGAHAALSVPVSRDMLCAAVNAPVMPVH